MRAYSSALISAIALAESIFPGISKPNSHCDTEPDIFSRIGEALADAQQPEAAECCRASAVVLQLESAQRRLDWAKSLVSCDRHVDAVRELRKAVILSNNAPGYRRALAEILSTYIGNFVEAKAILETVVIDDASPNNIEALAEVLCSFPSRNPLLGNVLLSLEKVAPRSSPFTVYRAVAKALLRKERYDEAAELCTWICSQNPNDSGAHCTLAWAMTLRGDYLQAGDVFRAALRLAPEDDFAAWSLACHLHSIGEYDSASSICRASEPLRRRMNRVCAGEIWDGQDLKGKTILLRQHRDYGFGDCIQFVRFADFAKTAGATVITSTRAPLVNLFRHSRGIDKSISVHHPVSFNVDYECPGALRWLLMHIPMARLGTSVPYITVADDDVRRFKQSIVPHDVAIGVTWEASDVLSDTAPRPLCTRRSIPLASLLRLHTMPGVTLFSLQRPRAEATWPRDPHVINDLMTRSGDFYDLAVAVCAMDLIISADTSIAHLAGALGKRTFLLLPYVPNWRWEHVRADSPWYPTITLIRQRDPTSWSSAITELISHLCSMTVANGTSSGIGI